MLIDTLHFHGAIRIKEKETRNLGRLRQCGIEDVHDIVLVEFRKM